MHINNFFKGKGQSQFSLLKFDLFSLSNFAQNIEKVRSWKR